MKNETEMIERAEKAFLDLGMQRMSRYFGKKKKSPGGMTYEHLLWDGHDQYYYVSLHDQMYKIWCSRSLGTDMESVSEFPIDCTDADLQQYAAEACNFILDYYRQILLKYSIADSHGPALYRIPESAFSERIQPEDSGIYTAGISTYDPPAKNDNIPVYDSLDSQWDELYQMYWNHFDIEEYNDALLAAKKMYAFVIENGDPDSLAAAVALFHQRCVFTAMEDYSAALATDEELIDMDILHVPEQIDIYCDCLSAAAYDAFKAGDIFSAAEYADMNILSCSDEYGTDDIQTLEAFLLAARIYKTAGRTKDSYYAILNAYAGYKKKYGNEADETLHVLSELAYLYSYTEMHMQAVNLAAWIYSAWQKKQEDNTDELLISLGNLSMILQNADQTKDAAAIARYVMIKDRQIHGIYSEEYICSLFDYGLCRLKDGKSGNARGYFKECLELLEHIKGNHRQLKRDLKKALASAEKKGKHYDKALAIYQEIYEEALAQFGEYDTRTISALESVLSLTYGQNYAETLRLLQRIYNAKCTAFGENNISTLGTLSNIAYAESETGNYAKAIQIQSDVYTACSNVYGPYDHDTLFFEKNLILLIYESGNAADAVKTAEDSYHRYAMHFGQDAEETTAMKELLLHIKMELLTSR